MLWSSKGQARAFEKDNNEPGRNRLSGNWTLAIAACRLLTCKETYEAR